MFDPVLRTTHPSTSNSLTGTYQLTGAIQVQACTCILNFDASCSHAHFTLTLIKNATKSTVLLCSFGSQPFGGDRWELSFPPD